ncbi:MMPL family transporter [bacterium AH-315-F18]|nr:MMPL family transporter [bacterium AH-315-F18]
MNAVAAWVVNHRGAVWLGLILLTVAAVPGLLRIGIDDNPRAIYRTDDDRHRLLEEFTRDFGSDDNQAVVLLEGTDIFTPMASSDLATLTAALNKIDGVKSVWGLGQLLKWDGGLLPSALYPPPSASAKAFKQSRKALLDHPFGAGTLMATDGRSCLIMVSLQDDVIRILALGNLMDRVRATVSGHAMTSGLKATVTGIPAIRVDLVRLLAQETVYYLVAGVSVCLLIALILFRSFWALLLVGVGPIIGLVWTMGFLGWVGIKIDLLMTLLPALILIIGLTDSVHLVFNLKKSREAGEGVADGVRQTIAHLGIPCLMTSVTTGVGFISLLTSSLPNIQTFGKAAAAGVSFTFLAVVLLVPLTSWWVPRLRPAFLIPTLITPSAMIKRTGAFARWSGRICLMGVVLSAFLLMACLTLRPDSRVILAMPDSGDSMEAILRIDKNFGGLMPFFVLVDWPENRSLKHAETKQALIRVHNMLDGVDWLSPSLSLNSFATFLPLPAADLEGISTFLPEALKKPWIHPEKRRLVVMSRVAESRGKNLQADYPALEARLQKLGDEFSGYRFQVTGTHSVANANINSMATDLAKGLAMASAIIVLLISLQFRSLSIGLLALLPNMLPLTAAGAFAAWMDRPLTVGVSLVFTVLLGIAVDDTIHILARFKREFASDGDLHRAVHETMWSVGQALLVTTAMLIAGMALVLGSPLPEDRWFAALMIVGLLMALLGDLILLPALLMLIHRGKRRG